MRALIYEGPGNIRFVEDVEVREPGAGEVLVRIAASGICHSDISVINGTIDWPAPAVLGHEGAGVVEKLGPGVTELAVGDHVALHTLANCGRCGPCESGRPTHCRQSYGNRAQPFSRNGEPVSSFAATSTFVEKTVVKANQAVRIDPTVPLDIACVVGCGVLTGVGSVVNRARVKPGETAAVFGIGGIGLNVLQGLRLSGASRIIAIDLLPTREAKAREFGATDFIDASKGDVPQRIKDIVSGGNPDHGSGVDWAFECVGNTRVLNDAMASLGWGGNCVIVGTTAAGTMAEVSLTPLSFVDRGVMGARYGASRPHQDIPSYIAQYRQGKLLLDELVTQRYDLADFERAFHDLEEGKLARGVFVL